MREWQRWIPAGAFALGCVLLLSVQRQRAMPLRSSLDSLPRSIEGFAGYDQKIPQEEQAVAGMSDYALRYYLHPDHVPAFTVYVGYYEQQTQGRTIHSPKNCLPGAGWEVLAFSRRYIRVAGDSVRVNRYELTNKNANALVYYWYQGRGRVEASEYAVKWELLRDAALKGRSEEALVRIVVPLSDRIPDPDKLASSVAEQLIPSVSRILPDPAV